MGEEIYGRSLVEIKNFLAKIPAKKQSVNYGKI